MTTSRTIKPALILCGALPVLLLLTGFFWNKPTWQEIDALINGQYPTVTNLGVDELQAALAQGQAPVLIDVRERSEFAVSHLPQAVNIRQAGAVSYPKDTALVVYCSVGVRSAAFAEKLAGLGFTNVRNLRGSIFAWANKKYPVWRGDKPVQAVHPYDTKWGVLLNRELHAYHPQ